MRDDGPAGNGGPARFVVLGLRTMRVVRWLLLAIVVVFLAGVAFQCSVGTVALHPWQHADVTGERTLSIEYIANECGELERVRADERPDEIVVSLWVRHRGYGCSDIGIVERTTVVLDDPVAGRQVTDRFCQVNPDARELCRFLHDGAEH